SHRSRVPAHASHWKLPQMPTTRSVALRLLHPDAERCMRNKIYGGTSSQSGRSLCETCRHSMITRGRKLEEEIVSCEALTARSAQITFVVTECSAHMDAALPTYHELFEKAWILRPRDGKRAAGFVHSSELSAKERFELMKDVYRFEEC